MAAETILVVGDWLVDEHWVVGPHRWRSSSRAGREHVRSLQQPDSCVRSLCGAGQTATILQNARTQSGSQFDVLGLGLWHAGEENEIQQMLDPKNNVGNTPYRLLSPNLTRPSSKGSAKLFNLAQETVSRNFASTRIVRIWERKQLKVELRSRIDWEFMFSEELRKEVADGVQSALISLGDPKKIGAIVIKDLGKGVVSKELIVALKKRFSKADWYVSTKDWQPPWYDDLPKGKVRLLLIPQLAAEAAIRTNDASLLS